MNKDFLIVKHEIDDRKKIYCVRLIAVVQNEQVSVSINEDCNWIKILLFSLKIVDIADKYCATEYQPMEVYQIFLIFVVKCEKNDLQYQCWKFA